MFVWFCVAMVPLFVWAGRGLGKRERVWVFALLGGAVALRLLALLTFYFLARPVDGEFPFVLDQAHGALFPALVPDESYLAYRARAVRYLSLGVPLASGDYAEMAAAYGSSSVIYMRAYLELLVGEAPYTMRLLNSGFYLAACVTLYRTVRPAFGALAALGGLAVLLFLPSLFVWSIAFLKDAPYLFLTAVSIAAASAAARTRSLRIRVLACAVCGAAVVCIGTVRHDVEIIVGVGVIAGLIATALMRRPQLIAVASVFCIVGAVAAQQSPSVQQWGKAQLARAATYHIGFAYTPGWNYKLFDADFYGKSEIGDPLPLDPDRFTVASTTRYTIRSIASVFLVPLPWDARSPAVLAYLPEQLVWNLLVVLAVIGVVAGLRTDAALTLILVGVVAVGAVAIGMSSGNIGTMIRHRALLVILVPWLGSLGACELLTWAVRFRRLAPGEPTAGAHDRGVYAVD